MLGGIKRGRFVGRAAELAALQRQHGREGAVLLPVYGRRRVGKSELLVHFCQGKPAVYFAATQGTATGLTGRPVAGGAGCHQTTFSGDCAAGVVDGSG